MFPPQFDLVKLVDAKQSYCLNESPSHKMLPVVKVEPPERQLSADIFLESDCDDQLLICIKFESDVKLTHIVIAAPPKDGSFEIVPHFQILAHHSPRVFCHN
jgi:hypothetical protein